MTISAAAESTLEGAMSSSPRVTSIMFTRVPGVTLPTEELMPRRQSDGAAGFDLRANRSLIRGTRDLSEETFPVTLQPGEVKLFGTGIIMAIPDGHSGDAYPRSGLAMKQVYLANSIGLVDSDYRGEVGLLLMNGGQMPLVVNKGDRIAQLVFHKIETPEFQYVDSFEQLPVTRRGAGGFGSTGVSGEGLGTTEYDSNIHRMDLYFMGIVLKTSGLSDCVRGCYLDGNGQAIRDRQGELIGQTRKSVVYSEWAIK